MRFTWGRSKGGRPQGRTRATGLGSLLVAILLATACTAPAAAPAAPGQATAAQPAAKTTGGSDASAKEPWRVGVITSFTGSANALGLEEINSYRLAAKLVNEAGGINGRQVQLIEDDDQSSPETAVKLVNKQISQDKVVGIIGGLSSGATLAVKPIVEEQKVALISAHVAVDTTKDNPKYLFRSAPSDGIVNEWIVKYAQNKGWKKLAILHDANAYGTGGMQVTRDIIKNQNLPIDVVAVESYKNEDTDMRAQLTKIKGTNPDFISIIGTNPAPALAVKQARELGLEAPIIGGTGMISPKTIELAGTASAGLIAPAYGDPKHPRPEQEAFVKQFQAEYGRPPQGFEYLGDGGYILLNALKHVTAEPSQLDQARQQLRDAMETQTKDLVWGIGPWNYSATNHDGADVRSLVSMVVKDGAWTRTD